MAVWNAPGVDSKAVRVLLAASIVLFCLPSFLRPSQPVATNPLPYIHGWLGGDAAYSIRLEPGRSLWLFGDTYVGTEGAKERSQATGFVRNSVGITNCRDKNCTTEYFWSNMKGSKPKSFFETNTDTWYWPLDGFVHNGALYIFLEEMHATGSGALGFDYSGVSLATIRNYSAPPDQWDIQIQNVVQGTSTIPGGSVVVGQGPDANPFPADPNGGAYVYAFSRLDSGSGVSYTALLRLPLGALNHASEACNSWQYLAVDHRWRPWTSEARPTDAAVVLNSAYSELTVRYHAGTHKWIAIAPGPEPFSKRATISTASSIAGPWSSPETLLNYPEMEPSNSNYTKNVFCYAAKEHPEFESGDEIFFTYACNSLVESEVAKNMNLYHPILAKSLIPEH